MELTEVVMSRDEWLKKACTRKHLDEASVKELIEAIHIGSRLKPETEGKYGPMNVFREYKPKKESVEYTVFFHLPGDSTKYRLDTEVLLEDMAKMDDPEKEIRDKIFKMIEAHEYKKAYEAVL